MKLYALTVENGVITDLCDEGEGVLSIPKDAVAFDDELLPLLSCKAEGITVEEGNPSFSAAHNCLLSADGKTLLKTCKASDIAALKGVEVIAGRAFDGPDSVPSVTLRLPSGVKTLRTCSCAVNAEHVNIVLPDTVTTVEPCAFGVLLDDQKTLRIEFQGDVELPVGVFATRKEIEDCEIPLLKEFPPVFLSRPECFTVVCSDCPKIKTYCRKYGITCITK